MCDFPSGIAAFHGYQISRGVICVYFQPNKHVMAFSLMISFSLNLLIAL